MNQVLGIRYVSLIALLPQEKGSKISQNTVGLKKLQKLLKSEITSNKNFPIIWYEALDLVGLSKIVFRPLIELQSTTLLSPSLGIDLLWHSSMVFQKDCKQPQWNGFMQGNFVGGSYPPTISLCFL